MLNTSTYVSIGPVEVPKALQDGEKFVKWDDDSGTGTPVTMRVDPKGYYLYWIDQNNEMDILDIATIRDTRTGPYAKKPKDSKLRQIVTLGSQDTLEEKTVTICHGCDFVNVTFVNFCSTKREIAQQWCDGIMRLAYSLARLNGSANTFLQKAHTKLCLQVDKGGKIPVKNIMKMFAQNKEDRKRVEKALDMSGLPSGKIETLSLPKFHFEDFFNLYKNLTQRSEVEKIFDGIVGNSKRKCMCIAQLVEFLNKTQRDPRLNEILYPYANATRAKEIIQEYEPNKFNAQKNQLSLDGFLRYLMSDDNPIVAPSKLDLCDDMDQPLSHYFVNSSHNTYLIGHQLTGKSSVEIYRQCLLAGCRCVELDFWNGRTDEPVIVHGYTLVPEINARDALEAIAESAFKTSEFPVILSFENHCNPRQQAKIANYCREIFGEMLLDKPLDSHPLEPNVDLPPPSLLKRKIIIKNKRKHHHHHRHKKGGAAAAPTTVSKLSTANSVDASSKATTNHATTPSAIQQQVSVQADNAAAAAAGGSVMSTPVLTGNGDISSTVYAPPLQQIRQNSKDSTGSSDTDSSSDDESMPNVTPNPPVGADPTAEKPQKETEAAAELSALVNYVEPVHFYTFENAEKKNRCYEMSSFDEKQATALLKERPIEFVNYNKHQLSRVYPTGTRFDSSNFMPQLFWNAGCQLVALNYQTLDLAMQLNLGIFEYNDRSGYLLKPEFMRRTDRRLDPFAESTVDGIIAGTVSITVLSGQFLTDKRVGTYVEVEMFGLPADTVRKRFRTRIVRDNGLNPVYDEEPFVFKKVVLPELANIRIAAYEEGGKFLGHRVLPVIGLCPGYRHVNLRTELGQPLTLASLFLYIVVKDYVPDDLSNFAEALANPIKYQSELEKRDKQLAVLTEGTEPISSEEDITNSFVFVQVGGQKKELRPVESTTMSPKHRASITTAATLSVEANAGGDHDSADAGTAGGPGFTHQHSLDSTAQTSIRQVESSQFDVDLVRAEPLDKILDNKLVREKRFELEKKLESLRKKHDKEKIKIAMQKSSPMDGNKKPMFNIASKLKKRLSNKNLDTGVEVPPCFPDIGDLNEDCVDGATSSGGESPALVTRSQQERLLASCRDYSTQYRDIQEKYYEIIYALADKVLRNSQANQMKQLKASLDRVTSEVMHQLQEARRTEVKNLSSVHRDRDELVRMKREVASSVVERGVAERVRLKQTYDKRTDDLQKQHESVRNALTEHRNKARQILEKEAESRICTISNGFLVLFSSGGAASTSATSNNLTLNLNGGNTISPARSSNSITNSTGGRNKDDLGGGDDETGANALAGAAAGV
ncbi:1-phosphatidylinositol 4,5-bisphosphate phosphodiesterase classes I and II isoform X2 [Bactrocera neohumeralis]|uniref:1-phosphatidylinositol 4,5-bisphosphate phosphodiesterase classes I and II isoform X1 n=1 Tax=Bactrocera tryoni TaxID=59916 RepID=UPI001A95B61D|nr:1-phosphatidylinositol 4,5-bisphosphate phosphodiesterase classes I and II isoform X1 [Bactrocera tryoni]XP_050319675.1 1-phosphatidylinositol 4,5-bisphosphate phosphodiesterase classes I and II isoform X2 [Bactrocera neohumeralis]